MKKRVHQLRRGLTREQALKAVKARIRGHYDFRGFTYDARTGKAVTV